MKWHANAQTRHKLGTQLEDRFQDEWQCGCGGDFAFIGDNYPGCPDFTCDNCGLLVDIKYSPQAEKTNNLAISARPWNGYPDDLLIVTSYKGNWVGQAKKQITPLNTRPFDATHKTRPTKFFLIPLRNFTRLEFLNFLKKGMVQR